MPRKLDPEIAAVLKDFGYGPEACWDCHGTWVVYHRVIEQIAAKAKITFDPPIVLEANSPAKCAAICVVGRKGDVAEWSIGEAAPGNNKNSYPYAMAEKRAKDRVVLKLVGLHGLAYSEDEADDFKPAPEPIKTEHSPLFLELGSSLPRMVSDDGLKNWGAAAKDGAERGLITSDEAAVLRIKYVNHVANLKRQKAA